MKRFDKAARCGFLVFIGLVQTLLVASQSAGQSPRPRRIAIFGSSVAFGTGDEFNKEGYTGHLRELLAPRGWEVLNQSRPGDTTRTAATRWAPEGTPNPQVRYLLPVNPGYVVIGLALTNEGIREAQTTQEKEAVFKQYADGIQGFVTRARQNNIVPIVGLAYPRMAYTLVEYEYVRRMNLLLNSWDVPSLDLLEPLMTARAAIHSATIPTIDTRTLPAIESCRTRSSHPFSKPLRKGNPCQREPLPPVGSPASRAAPPRYRSILKTRSTPSP